MEKIKILLVEDNLDEYDTFVSSITRYMDENKIQIEHNHATNVSDAIKLLDNSYDGAIIDLKLDITGDEGNLVINSIHQYFRIPIIVFSGTPDNLNSNISYILNSYKKGEIEYVEILQELYSVHKTGLSRIIGGKGVIERTINHIFWNNLHPKISIWEKYSNGGKDTEKALLRYTLNHLLELIDNEEYLYLPEEMYLSPPLVDTLKPGTIVKKKSDSKNHYIVLSPACDLVIHHGNCKTDSILLCEINKVNMHPVPDLKIKLISDIDKDKEEAKVAFGKLIGNNYSMFYHYLPPVEFFEGGFINFRKVESYKPKLIRTQFDKVDIQISQQFIKDIISRFSSYYARQGQPDFNTAELINTLSHL